MVETRDERDYRYALARAMQGIQCETPTARERAFRRLEADFGWVLAAKVWREALRIKRDVDEAVDKNGGEDS